MARDVEIVVSENAVQDAAERLAAAARLGGACALTVGWSARDAYELVRALETDWTRVELWWGDERCVAPDDERSNYGMAKAALLDRLEVEPAAVHRMRGELGRDAGASEYDAEAAYLRVGTFDLVLLGLGPD